MAPTSLEGVPTTEFVGSVLDTEGVEPWEWLTNVRELGDVVWDHGAQAWLVTSYELVREMSLSDIKLWARPEQASDSPESGFDRVPPGEEPAKWAALVARVKAFRDGKSRTMELIQLKGAEHDHQHRWWMSAMSPRTLEKWRETLIRPLAHEQVDLFVDRGRVELCSEFVDPMVPRMIAAVMGEPTDREWVDRHSRWADDVLAPRLGQLREYADPEVMRRAVIAGEGLHEALRPVIDAKRAGDSDDVIGMIWRDAEAFFAPEKYGPYDEDDIFALALNIGHSGTNTVRASAQNTLYMLLAEPHLQDDLRIDVDERAARLAEEAMRLYGPVDLRPRVALRDTELGGVSIHAGEKVLGLRVAANRDGDRYACPGTVDLHRRAPRDHFSFYKGPRACPGQSLARMIVDEVLRVALERMPELRFDEAAPPPTYTGLILRRWLPLHARFG